MDVMAHFNTIIAALVLAGTIAGQQAKPATATAALQGTWQITSINGQAAQEGSPELTLTFTKDGYYQTFGGKVNERGTIKVDATKKPMTIDLIITEGDDAGKTQLGLIEASGDTLRASFARPAEEQRPADLKQGALVIEAKKKGKG